MGIVAFGLAQGFITGSWMRATLTPNPLVRPWFTNSTGSVLLTAGIVALGALVAALGTATRRAAIQSGVTVGVGAMIAMLAIMAPKGTWDLGPIVFIVGGVILLAAGAAGGSIAATLKPR
jgi:hypothetical protein